MGKNNVPAVFRIVSLEHEVEKTLGSSLYKKIRATKHDYRGAISAAFYHDPILFVLSEPHDECLVAISPSDCTIYWNPKRDVLVTSNKASPADASKTVSYIYKLIKQTCRQYKKSISEKRLDEIMAAKGLTLQDGERHMSLF